ncbi:MAG TPA: type I restriction-modification enzyme R subunit C-terminal domain-containing protein [Candidatus Acidoferrales bacterium]|nr:type I restriction-modification enzyme R subunit C-terminal domain-containing protein [Candidatus Acidoferrales bacterium]
MSSDAPAVLEPLINSTAHPGNENVPITDTHFNVWLNNEIRHSRESGNPEPFTTEQLHWLEMIRDHIAANLGIEPDDFEYAPFSQHGGLGKVHQLFGDKLNTIIEELNETLAA